MKSLLFFLFLGTALFCLVVVAGEADKSAAAKTSKPEWSIRASDIEACSCPMFCQCYFNAEPAAHHSHSGGGQHFCRFNMAFKVDSGYFKETDITGAKFWVTGDLGANFGDGQTEWAIVTFDKSTSQKQRDGIVTILTHMFPVKWTDFKTAEGTIDKWEKTNDYAHATLNGGKTAEIKLKRFPGNSDEPVVIKNLRYFGTLRNDGFVMMPNEVQAYREGPKAFEFKETTGFFIVVDMNSNDIPTEAM